MKKLLLIFLLLLSGCSSDLSRYPHYNVTEPSEKAKLYIDVSKEHFVDSQSKIIQQALQEYFIPASKQDADFVLMLEKREEDETNPLLGALSIITIGIIPAVDTLDLTDSYSLTDTTSGTVVRLSDTHTKIKQYFGWLLTPALFFSDVKLGSLRRYAEKAVAVAIKEAASLVYNPNSRLYKAPEKRPVLKRGKRETEASEQSSVPAAPATTERAPVAPAVQKPVAPEDLDLLW